jgi:hypothetical protein
MRTDFTVKLHKWKTTESIYGEKRNIKIEKIEDEYRIEIKLSVTVNVQNQSEFIEESVKFYTQTQSENRLLESNEDLYTFDTLQKKLTENFSESYNHIASELLKNITSDGF